MSTDAAPAAGWDCVCDKGGSGCCGSPQKVANHIPAVRGKFPAHGTSRLRLEAGMSRSEPREESANPWDPWRNVHSRDQPEGYRDAPCKKLGEVNVAPGESQQADGERGG